MLGSAESEKARLISRETSFTEFQPGLYNHETSTLHSAHIQTDRQLALAMAIPLYDRLCVVKTIHTLKAISDNMCKHQPGRSLMSTGVRNSLQFTAQLCGQFGLQTKLAFLYTTQCT